jgi:hypothetical protein
MPTQILLLILLQVTKEKMPTQKHAIAKNAKDNPKKSSFKHQKRNTVSFIKTLQNAKKTTPPPKNTKTAST